MGALQRPPIPQAPLVDQNGYVSREWWRWFASVGVQVSGTAGDVTTINNSLSVVGEIAQSAPQLADAIDTPDLVRQSLALRPPADTLPLDQLALAPLLLPPPADPLPIDQIALLAQLLQLPPEPIRGGEFVSSEVANTTVSMTSTVVANMTSIDLSAGDWEVWATVTFAPAPTTTITFMKSGINTTSATLPVAPGGGALITLPVSNTVNNNVALPVGRTRLSISAVTTVYLVATVTFGTSTLTGGGGIYARRIKPS